MGGFPFWYGCFVVDQSICRERNGIFCFVKKKLVFCTQMIYNGEDSDTNSQKEKRGIVI